MVFLGSIGENCEIFFSKLIHEFRFWNLQQIGKFQDIIIVVIDKFCGFYLWKDWRKSEFLTLLIDKFCLFVFVHANCRKFSQYFLSIGWKIFRPTVQKAVFSTTIFKLFLINQWQKFLFFFFNLWLTENFVIFFLCQSIN